MEQHLPAVHLYKLGLLEKRIWVIPMRKEAESPRQRQTPFLCSHLSKTKDLKGTMLIGSRVDAILLYFIRKEVVPRQEKSSRDIHHVPDTETRMGLSLHFRQKHRTRLVKTYFFESMGKTDALLHAKPEGIIAKLQESFGHYYVSLLTEGTLAHCQRFPLRFYHLCI